MAFAANDSDLPSLSSPVPPCGNDNQRYRDGSPQLLLAKIGQWQPPQQANTDSLPLTSPPPSTLTSTKSLCYSYSSHTIHHCLWSLCFHHVLSSIVVVNEEHHGSWVCKSPALLLPLPIMAMTMWEEAHNRRRQIIKNWPIYSISSTGASPPPGPCWLGLIFSFVIYIHHCQICHNYDVCWWPRDISFKPESYNYMSICVVQGLENVTCVQSNIAKVDRPSHCIQ